MESCGEILKSTEQLIALETSKGNINGVADQRVCERRSILSIREIVPLESVEGFRQALKSFIPERVPSQRERQIVRPLHPIPPDD